MKKKPKKVKKPRIVIMKDKAGNATIVTGANRMNLVAYKIEMFYLA